MRILIAEDERASRVRIEAFLRQWKYTPVVVKDGKEALEILKTQDISLVISDWLMPEIDGLELIRRVRSEALHDTYVYFIMLTSRTEREAFVEGMEAGADDFIVKPFDQEELRVRVLAGQRVIALRQALAEKNRRLEALNKRMKDELLAAARIQRSYLPSTVPNIPGVEFAWVHEPCDELAGDTLNIVRFDSSRVGIYVLDVSGHGVSSALLSVHLSRILSRLDETDAELRKPGTTELTPPAEVAADLNIKFSDNPASGQFFTLMYGTLDLEKRTFCFTSAGHPGPIVCSNGKKTVHRPTPPAIGFLPKAKFKQQTLELKQADRLFLYTDGIFEVENEHGEQWSEEQMAEVAAEHSEGTIQENVDAIYAAAREWNGTGNPLPDDLSLVGIAII